MDDRAKQIIEVLKKLPPDWQITPTSRKKPYRPGWRTESLDRSEIKRLIEKGDRIVREDGTSYSVNPDGMALIIPAETVVVDCDGKAARQLLLPKLQKGVSDPPTVAWTSGKQDRASALYKLPESLLQRLEALPRSIRKVTRCATKAGQTLMPQIVRGQDCRG